MRYAHNMWMCVCVDVAHVLCPQIPRNTWKCVCTVKAACTHARTGRGLVNAWKCDGSREGKPTTQASVTEARPGIPPRWNWKSWLKFVFVYLHLYLCICICVFAFAFVYLHLYLCVCKCIWRQSHDTRISHRSQTGHSSSMYLGKFSSCQCGNFFVELHNLCWDFLPGPPANDSWGWEDNRKRFQHWVWSYVWQVG